MYADNTLTPKEAARLCALGVLATYETVSYVELAAAVRHFIDRVQGPSLDVLGSSLELLKYEGLVRTTGTGANAQLTLTDTGRDEFTTLLTAGLRLGATDLNKLIVALKFRFLHMLDAEAQRVQVDLMLDTVETELTRLIDLRTHHAGEPGHLKSWLDREISELSGRAVWLRNFQPL